MRARQIVVPGLALVLVASLGACSSGDADDRSDDARPSVVASTDVWGDVVAQVGGDLVDVTSIIDDPSADPHSFEGSARVQLALSRADLVVVNGGGYDDFASTMVGALDHAPLVLDAVEVSGLTAPAGGELNEHVWYDLDVVGTVAQRVADELAQVDPDHAEQYAAQADAFAGELDGLRAQADEIAAAHAGEGFAVTEPVPVYLAAAAGLEDRTPPEFAEAIEEEVDVPPAVMEQMLDLVASTDVAVLVYNEQTTGPQTDQVLAAARAADLPVVPATETLPEGEDYVSWMAGTLEALAQALA